MIFLDGAETRSTWWLARQFNYWQRLDRRPSGEPVPLTRQIVLCDLAERLVVSIIFITFVHRMLGFSEIGVLTLLLCVGEALPFIYIVLRAPSASLSRDPLDWVFGIMGSITPLLIVPVPATPLAPLAICFMLMLCGIFLQISAKVVLGRSFGIIAANRGIKVLGPYRLVRHPMYAGYTLTHIGFVLSMPSLVNTMCYAVALGLQIMRIYREERVLITDASYRTLTEHVRYRLLPGVF